MKLRNRLLFQLLFLCLFFGGALFVAPKAFAACTTTLCTVTTSSNWSVLGATPISSTTVAVCNGATLTVDVSNAVAGTITLGDASSGDGCGGGSKGNGTLVFNASSQVTVATINIGNGTQTGTVTMTSGGTLIVNTSIAPNATTSTFTPGTGTVQIGGTQTLPSTASFNTYNNLTFGTGTGTLGESITVNGNITNNATFAASTFDVTMGGSGAQTIGGSGTFSFNNLTISNTAATVSDTTNITIGSGSTLTINASAAFSAGASNTVNTSAQGTLTVNGTLQVTRTAATADLKTQYNFATYSSFGANSTIDYNGTGETLNAFTYQNLKVSGTITGAEAGTATVNGTLNVTGTLNPGAQTISMATTGWSITNSGTCTFNNLTISETPSTQTTSSFSVAGALTLNAGKTLHPGLGTITFTGTGWSIVNNGTLLNFSRVTFAGTPTSQPNASTFAFSVDSIFTLNSGVTLQPGSSSGTITFNNGSTISNSNSAGNQANLTFYNITTASGASVSSNGTATGFAVAGTFTIGSNSTYSPQSADIISGSGSLVGTSSTSSIIQVTGVGGSPSLITQYTITTLTLTNLEVDYVGTLAQTVTATNYSTLKVMPGANSVTDTFAAGTTTASGNVTFGDGTHTSAAITASTNSTTLSVTGNIIISANTTFTANGSNNTSVGGNWTDSGTFTANSGTVVFNGTAGQNIASAETFANLTDSNTSASLTTSAVNISVTGTLTMNSSTILAPNASTVFNSGGAAGTITGSGTVQVTRTAATADYSSQYKFSTNTLTNLTVEYNATSSQTISAVTYGNLLIDPALTGSISDTFAGATTINGNFTINPSGGGSLVLTVNMGGNVTVASGKTTLIEAAASTTGTLDTVAGQNYALSTGLLDIESGGSLVGEGSTITLTATSGTPFTNNGTFTYGTSTVDFSETGADLTLTAGTLSNTNCTNTTNEFYNLQIDMSGHKGTLGVNGLICNNLTVNAGTLDDGGKTVTGPGSGGSTSFTLGSGAQYNLGSSGTATSMPTFHSYSFNSASTVLYQAGTAQTISNTPSYGNLTMTPLSGTVTYTLGGATIAAGALTISANATLDTSSGNNYGLTVGGNWTNNGTFTAQSGTVTFNGSGTQTLSGATTFNNFTDTTAGGTLKFKAGQIFTFQNNFTTTGSSGSHVAIQSDTPSSQWLAHFTLAQPSSVTFSTVTDSGCDTGTANVTTTGNNDTDGGNNGTCWGFPGGGSSTEVHINPGIQIGPGTQLK